MKEPVITHGAQPRADIEPPSATPVLWWYRHHGEWCVVSTRFWIDAVAIVTQRSHLPVKAIDRAKNLRARIANGGDVSECK